METLILGCVEPACDLDLARLLMAKHGLIFMRLSDAIMSLTGQGGEVEKSRSLWAEPGVRTALYLAEARGRFLFEIRPDICPEGYLTDLETALWERFYEHREQQRQQQKRR